MPMPSSREEIDHGFGDPGFAGEPTMPKAPTLAECPDCGTAIGRAMFSCPDCGLPFTEQEIARARARRASELARAKTDLAFALAQGDAAGEDAAAARIAELEAAS